MRNGRSRAFIRNVATLFAAEGPGQGSPQANNRGELCIVQALPPLGELTRLRNSWVGTAVNAAAVSTDPPTTTASTVLYNGERAGGKSYVIDWVGTSINIAVGIPTISSLWVQLLRTNPTTVPSGNYSLNISSTSGMGHTIIPNIAPSYTGKGILKVSSGNVIIVPNDAWHHIGNSNINSNTSAFTSGNYTEVYGRYMIPPQGQFCIALVMNALQSTTSNITVCWHEVQLPRG